MPFPFKPGQTIRCVNEDLHKGENDARDCSLMITGAVYTVHEILSGENFSDGLPALTVKELGEKANGFRPAFWPDMFEVVE